MFYSQIHFHNRDWPSLHKYINPEILPAEYGGQIASLDYTKLQRVLYDNLEQLMGESKEIIENISISRNLKR
jgi:hypothetical protein